jgi:hypothetical protein
MRPLSGDIVGAMWYKTVLQDSADCGVTDEYTAKPSGYDTGTDAIHWAVVVSPNYAGYTLATLSGEVQLSSTTLKAGLNFGSGSSVSAGIQRIDVIDTGGSVVQSATGYLCVSEGCPEYIFNMNYQVVPLSTDTARYGCRLPQNGVPTGILADPSEADTGCTSYIDIDDSSVQPLDVSSLGDPISGTSYFWVSGDCKYNTNVGPGWKNRADYYVQAYKDAVDIADKAQAWPMYGTDASDMYFGFGTDSDEYSRDIIGKSRLLDRRIRLTGCAANIKAAANWDNPQFGFDHYIVCGH